MYRLILLIVCAAIILSGTTISRAQNAQEPIPKTKIEAFTGEIGGVSIKGYVEIGSIKGINSATITAITIRDAKTDQQRSGVIVEISEYKSYGLDQRRSYVDFDEISALLEGIDYISLVDYKVTKMPFYEAQYATRGDLKLTVFNDAKGARRFSAQVGTIGSKQAIFPIDQLTQFRNLVARAKATIENPELASQRAEPSVTKSDRGSPATAPNPVPIPSKKPDSKASSPPPAALMKLN